MTTPPVQDGERERLITELMQAWHMTEAPLWRDVGRMLCADAETIRTQSAELAALRAQVEGLRKDAQRYQWIRGNEHMDIAACWLITADTPYAPQTAEELDAAIDASLAPPQPVAKEK